MVIKISSYSIIDGKNVKLRKIAKVLFLGDGAVGKTSLITLISVARFGDKQPPMQKPKVTVGFDIQVKYFMANGHKYEIAIWDFAGQPQFRFYQKDFMKYGIIGVLVYDVTRMSTLKQLKEWKKIAEENSSIVKFIVIANKVDSEKRSISRETGEQLAAKFGAPYIETSAKSLEGINELIDELEKSIVYIDSELANLGGKKN